MPPAPIWHIAQVITRQSDRQAAERLGRHFQVYAPQESLWRPARASRTSKRHRMLGIRRMERIVRPLFPRYLFCRFHPGDAWHEAFDAAGVSGLATHRGLPVSVSDDLVAALRSQEIDGVIPGTVPASRIFQVGQAIEVKGGSFAGLRGTVEKIKTAALDEIDIPTRVTVMLQLFGQPTPVDLDAAAVT